MLTKVKGFIEVVKNNGFKGIISILRNKVKNRLNQNRDFGSIYKYFQNTNGLEIGGPSGGFSNYGYIPVYKLMKSLDGVNFSSSTVWTGEIDQTGGFMVDGKNVGKLYIADTIDLSQVKNENYDFILSSNNIEHIANPMKALEQWTMKLKTNGIIVIVAPRKKVNFDHRRAFVQFSHLLEDYKNNTGENDLTHLEEVLQYHDLSRDLPAGTMDQFKDRCLKNFENRCMHHHVFNNDVLIQMCEHFNLAPILTKETERDYIVVAKKSGFN